MPIHIIISDIVTAKKIATKIVADTECNVFYIDKKNKTDRDISYNVGQYNIFEDCSTWRTNTREKDIKGRLAFLQLKHKEEYLAYNGSNGYSCNGYSSLMQDINKMISNMNNFPNAHLIIQITNASDLPLYFVERINYVYIHHQSSLQALTMLYNAWLHRLFPNVTEMTMALDAIWKQDEYVGVVTNPLTITVCPKI